MNVKVYLSDEGYGHIVRQNAILEAIRVHEPNLKVTIQTHKHLDAAKRIIKANNFIDDYNNISWFKHPNGSPDIDKIEAHFSEYNRKSDNFIEKYKQDSDYDFILADFVYEAAELGKLNNTPTFGVAHFTWDWFFSKLYPPPLPTSVLNRFFTLAKSLKKIYFPPFTPIEILNYYKKQAVQVPFIIRENNRNIRSIENNNQFKVLIIDSGAGVLKNSIRKSISKLAELTDFHFYLAEGFEFEAENFTFIPKDHLFVDYISKMDLVIGRAGFNTITECIACRTPMLLIGEAMNPEMNENIIQLKKEGLGSFMSLEKFENDLVNFLPKFVGNEYNSIKVNMQNHGYGLNGAEIIAKDILNSL